MLINFLNSIIALISILLVVYAGVFLLPWWTWIFFFPLLLYNFLFYKRYSIILMKLIIDKVVRDRFEVLTLSGRKIDGEEVEVFGEKFVIIRDKEVEHSIRYRDVKTISLITKNKGRESMTIKEFVEKYPSK